MQTAAVRYFPVTCMWRKTSIKQHEISLLIVQLSAHQLNYLQPLFTGTVLDMIQSNMNLLGICTKYWNKAQSAWKHACHLIYCHPVLLHIHKKYEVKWAHNKHRMFGTAGQSIITLAQQCQQPISCANMLICLPPLTHFYAHKHCIVSQLISLNEMYPQL